MNSWEQIAIGDFCRTGSGGTPLKFHKDYYEGGTIPWLLSGEVAQGEIYESTNFITQKGLDNSAAKLFPPDSVLVAMYGATAGQVGILRFPAATNQAVCAILPNSKVVPEYMFYALLSKQDELIGQATGNAQPNISQIKIRNTRIPLAPLAEQRRIVALLAEAFAGLATMRVNAEANLKNARALFDSQLNSIFSQTSDGWVETTVSDLVRRKILAKPFDGNHGEIHPTRADYVMSGVPFIMARDLIDGDVDQMNCVFISSQTANSLRVGFAKNGDVLISHKGTIGRSAILTTRHDFVMLTPQVTSYRILDQDVMGPTFLRYYFMSPKFQSAMSAAAADGSTRAYVGITKQLSLAVRFPCLELQRKAAGELVEMRKETARLESFYRQKLAAIDELKQSILQKAFAGELTATKEIAA